MIALRHRPKSMRRARVRTAVAAALLAGTCACSQGSPDAAQVSFTVPNGAPFGQVVDTLEARELVGIPLVFEVVARLRVRAERAVVLAAHGAGRLHGRARAPRRRRLARGPARQLPPRRGTLTIEFVAEFLRTGIRGVQSPHDGVLHVVVRQAEPPAVFLRYGEGARAAAAAGGVDQLLLLGTDGPLEDWPVALPQLWEAHGAAWAAAIADLFVVSAAFVLLRRAGPGRELRLAFAPRIVLAAAAALAVALIPGLPALVAAAIAAVVFTGAAFALRIVPAGLSELLPARGTP